MNKHMLLVALCVTFFISGCASTGPVKNSYGSNAIYTNASREVAFNAASQALQNLGYKIELKDQENFYVKGSYWNPLTGYAPTNAQVDITQEASGAKIVNSIHLPQGNNFLGYTSVIYAQRAENIYKEESKILSQGGFKVQKSQ